MTDRITNLTEGTELAPFDIPGIFTSYRIYQIVVCEEGCRVYGHHYIVRGVDVRLSRESTLVKTFTSEELMTSNLPKAVAAKAIADYSAARTAAYKARTAKI